jgi:uncharacterized surface protein with fasciclin (FAS1) repeats
VTGRWLPRAASWRSIERAGSATRLLQARTRQWLRSLLEAEPGAPGLLWSDAAYAHLEARRTLHRVVRTASEALLASAELASTLGRAGTLELFADTLDAFPRLVAKAVAAR